MATTYMELTNRLLRRIGEVVIVQADFASVTGIHAAAKDAINDALREIMTSHYQWSFNAVEQTDTLVAGTFEYAWPDDFKSVEWKSFQIQKDDSLSVQTTTLKPIERDYYYSKDWYEEDRDGISDSTRRGVPTYVFQTHGQGFGLTPNPDAAYSLKYRYYKSFTPLSAYDDETLVPTEFDHVIVLGALVHMNYFLDNNEQAKIVKDEQYIPALRAMRTLLINDDFRMSDTRVNNVNVG